jgi:hypothetical protein
VTQQGIVIQVGYGGHLVGALSAGHSFGANAAGTRLGSMDGLHVFGFSPL